MHFPQKNGDQTWAKNDRKGKKGRSISNCILTLKYIQDDVSLIGRHFTGLGQSTHKGGVRTIFFFYAGRFHRPASYSEGACIHKMKYLSTCDSTFMCYAITVHFSSIFFHSCMLIRPRDFITFLIFIICIGLSPKVQGTWSTPINIQITTFEKELRLSF